MRVQSFYYYLGIGNFNYECKLLVKVALELSITQKYPKYSQLVGKKSCHHYILRKGGRHSMSFQIFKLSIISISSVMNSSVC